MKRIPLILLSLLISIIFNSIGFAETKGFQPKNINIPTRTETIKLISGIAELLNPITPKPAPNKEPTKARANELSTASKSMRLNRAPPTIHMTRVKILAFIQARFFMV